MERMTKRRQDEVSLKRNILKGFSLNQLKFVFTAGLHPVPANQELVKRCRVLPPQLMTIVAAFQNLGLVC